MAVLLELLNKNDAKYNTSFNAVKIYPQINEEIEIFADNVYIKDNKLVFDLVLENVDLLEYESIRIIPLNEQELQKLDGENFPATITEASRGVLFEDAPDVITFTPGEDLQDIEVSLKELTEENFNVLIVLEDAPEINSDVFLLPMNKAAIVQTKNVKTENYSDVFNSRFTELTNLEIIEDKTYVSNLIYSCDTTGMFNGLFSLDRRKLLNDNTRFPNLVSLENNSQFEQFLYDTKVFIYKYDKDDAGYNFTERVTTGSIKPVEDLIVTNFNEYGFYEFTADLNDYVSDLQVVLKFHLNDITINLAKVALLDLKNLRDANNREDSTSLFVTIYGDEFQNKFGVSLFDIEKIPNLDFINLINKVIGDLQDQIDAASQKVVVNENLKSQYTSEKFSKSTYYRGVFEQKFEQKINLSKKQINQLLPNQSSENGFLVVDTDTATGLLTEEQKILTVSNKQFKIISKDLLIDKFILTSKKDKTLRNEGIQAKVNLSDSDEKSQKALSEQEQQQFLSFSSEQERLVKFYYLKRVGDSASALIFSEIDDEFPGLGNLQGRILIRMDNYEEFYNSYFYISNSQG